MKKYIIFMISFFVLYMLFQVVSGWILTALYTPSFSSNDSSLSNEVTFGNTSVMPFVVIVLIASLAYFISQKSFKTEHQQLDELSHIDIISLFCGEELIPFYEQNNFKSSKSQFVLHRKVQAFLFQLQLKKSVISKSNGD